MQRKSTTVKIKKMIYPAAFVLIVILSAVYKYVFKGSGDITVGAFKNGKTVTVTGDTAESIAPENTTGPTAITSDANDTPDPVPLISVYICGEVMNPGIYEAPKGVMLNEIIEDAGGFTGNASSDNINLVYLIECNMSIYIPSKEETAKGLTGGDIIRQDGVYVWGAAAGMTPESGNKDAVMLNINTATVEELKTLPGIGEVTAKAIADYRKDNPFKTVEDIKNVSGIGESKYNRIKNHICV